MASTFVKLADMRKIYMINYFKELLTTLKSIDSELKKQNKKVDDLITYQTVGRFNDKRAVILTKHYKEGTI